MRVVGATAIALAASMAIQTRCLPDRPPPTGTRSRRCSPGTRRTGHGRDFAVGQEALHLPLLLGFVTGLHGLVGRRGGAGGLVAPRGGRGRDLSAVFALSAVLWIGVVLSAGELAEPSPAFELVWQLHAAAFALALPALGTTFIGAALAAHTSRLSAAWQRLPGVAGEACCSPPGRPASRSRTARRSCSWAAGLAAWLVWLPVTGVRLVRARTADRPDNASTYDEEE